MDFTLLSDENRLLWLKFFSDTVVKLNTECTLLRSQLEQYRETSLIDSQHKDKVEFVSKVASQIKSDMFKIFLRLNFPSIIEVTSSCNCHAFVSFGLTQNCALANLVFAIIFQSSHGTSSKPVTILCDHEPSPTTTSSMSSAYHHKFDTDEMREDLWFNFGLGLFAIKAVKSVRNTYTNLICEVVSKFFH